MSDNKHYNLCVPTEFTKKGETESKTSFTKVGVMFESARENGEKIFNIRLDFPVGATELVAFEPKSDS